MANASEAEREIVISREFNAPRELVFDVFTDVKHISNWWGPNGFRTTTKSRELRPGGAWLFTMHGPDGVDYPNRVIYREVVRPEKLVYYHDDNGEGESIRFDVTVTFEKLSEKQTKTTMRMVFPTPEERDRVVRDFGAIEGGQQTLARLAEQLAALQK